MNYHQRKQVFLNRLNKWNKKIYIAKKIGVTDDGYEDAIYDQPKEYLMNVQPISSEADIAEFGGMAKQMQKAVVEYNKYFGKFNEFDIAYLDGATPKNEEINGQNANYKIHPPRNQNKCIVIYFERISNK